MLVDAHIDLAYNAVVLERDLTQPVEEIRAAEGVPPPHQQGVCLVSLPALLAGEVAVVGSSIFVAPATKSKQEPQSYRTPEEAHRFGSAQLDYYRRLDEEVASVRLLHAAVDLEAVLASWETDDPEIGLFVVMEGADPIREPGELAWWVEHGLRGVGPTWSRGTRYAGGNRAPGPLRDAGVALLDAMADHNLLLDLSHLWEDAAYTALDRYPGPIAVTHGNPRAFVDSPRLLSDDLMRRLAEREGVIGIVPYNRMLRADWRTGDPRLPIQRVVEAVDYVCQLTGTSACVGLGSDFDGGFGREAVPAGLDSVADLPKIGDALLAYGYSSGDVAGILRENWLRLMRQTLAR